MAKIQDFGNKIGGAKKDLWKLRGLILEDIIDMNDTERNKYIKKDNVWIKPDYQSMVDKGVSKRVAYFIKTIRDSLPAHPKGSHEYQDGFIRFISDIRDRTMAITSEQEILSFFDDVILKNYVEKAGYSYRALPSTYGYLSNKLFHAAQVRNLNSLDIKIKKSQFLYSEEEKILDGYSFYKYENAIWNRDYNGRVRIEIKFTYGATYLYPSDEYANQENWQEGKYFVLDSRHNILFNNIETLEQAKALTIEKAKSEEKGKEKNNRKKRFIPIQLQHIKRVGNEYRNNHNITGDDMLNVFGFYGGEFGNWLNENDRQQNLNYSYDAFVDLAKALNISNRDIALKGELSIAYGARGRAGASAHYEPERRVINLTKMSGAGSLAHEWGHALDHYLSRTLLNKEGYLSESNSEIIRPLKLAMKYKELPPEESLKVNQEDYKKTEDKYILFVRSYFYKVNLSDEQQDKFKEIIKSLFAKDVTYEDYSSVIKNKTFNNDATDTFEKLEQIGIKNISDEIKRDIVFYQQNLTERRKHFNKPISVLSDFYENSKAMDSIYSKEDKGYWQSDIEMFARAFACYIKDKLSPEKSDYLCGHAESAISTVVNSNNNSSKVIKAFPEGEERKNINQCFDKLIELVKEKNIFQEFNQEEVTFQPYKNFEDNDISNDEFEQTSFFDNLDDYEQEFCEYY